MLKHGIQGLVLGSVLLSLGSCSSSSKCDYNGKKSYSSAKSKANKVVNGAGNLGSEKTSISSDNWLEGDVNSGNFSNKQKMELIASRTDDISTRNINGVWGAYLPNYLYDSGFILGLDYLCLRTDAEGFDYAVEEIPSVSSTGDLDVNYRPQRIKFGFDSGFRLGMGYTFANNDQWDLMFNWTYFHNSESEFKHVAIGSTFNSASDAYLTTPWSTDFLGDYISQAKANWRLNYNVGDIELGRNFFIGQNLSIRPMWGVRGAWLYQNNKVNYTGYYGYATSSLAQGTSQVKSQNNWHGVGLRTGADMRFSFTQSFALLGKFSASLLYGRFILSQEMAGNQVSGTGVLTPTTFSINEGFNAIRPELEASLGFEYSTFFSRDQYHLALAVAWEVQEWFEQNQLERLYEFTNSRTIPSGGSRTVYSDRLNRVNENLGIQGIRVSLRFDF